MAEFETTTRRGRVVYKRKKHYFGPADVLRIWNSIKKILEPRREIDQETKNFFLFLGWDMIKTVDKSATLVFEKETEKEIIDEIEKTIQNLSIGMLVEIVEKIPFVPQKYEIIIAENIYWTVWHFLKNLIS